MGKLSASHLFRLEVENEGCAWTFYRVSYTWIQKKKIERESFNFSLHKCSMLKLLTVLCRKTTINVKGGIEDVNLFVSQRCDIYQVFTLLISAAAWHILSNTTETVRSWIRFPPRAWKCVWVSLRFCFLL